MWDSSLATTRRVVHASTASKTRSGADFSSTNTLAQTHVCASVCAVAQTVCARPWKALSKIFVLKKKPTHACCSETAQLAAVHASLRTVQLYALLCVHVCARRARVAEL